MASLGGSIAFPMRPADQPCSSQTARLSCLSPEEVARKRISAAVASGTEHHPAKLRRETPTTATGRIVSRPTATFFTSLPFGPSPATRPGLQAYQPDRNRGRSLGR